MNPRARARSILQRLVPPDVSKHLIASQREMLLAMRSVLDRAIDRMEEGEEKVAERNIPVE